jgi:hypothetical protein
MASTYSTNLALELIGTGEQSGTWGTTTNTNLGTLLEQAISGYVTQAITDGSGANTTITIPNGATGVARNMFIEMTGALSFSTTSLIVPANKKMYFVFNNTSGGFAVTVKVSGQTGILVPNGKKVILTCNGTDIVEAHTAIVGNATMGGTLGVTGVATLGNGAILGTPASATLTNATGLPISSGVSGLGTGVATALGVNTGSAGAMVLFNGALGTPTSGTVTNLTGTASININGTVGATTPAAGAFTTVSATGTITPSIDIQFGAGGTSFYTNQILRHTNDILYIQGGLRGIQLNRDSNRLDTIDIGSTANQIDVITNGATRTRTTNSGLAVTGTLSATTGAAVGGATAGAGGLAFPATQVAVADANTLDDYEEGTWTPTLTPATSGTITLGSPNLCAYTKIGRLVTVSGVIDTASVSAPVGATVTVNNLPFASNATGTQRSAGVARCFGLTSGSLNTTINIVSSVTTFVVYVDASLFQTSSQIYFQLSYTV